ncbi:helix-turn-helix domain-containing protein [Caulobacter sp. KR2-114]|uniref:helix-turn-helix domain-containing protein n=1 Tax=Caulobacter sp. KR2-114 TaxID=3400912 RepID=UPI003C046A6B
MDDILDDTTERLARRILAEREARGWSLAEVATRSGVSKAMISKVERGEASPTATLLVRLASAFGLTLATLLARAEGGGGRLSRAAEQPAWRDPASGYVRRQVFAHPESPIELTEVDLPPGAEVAFPAASYAFIRQVVWARAGALTIEDGATRVTLSPGDAYAFGEPADARFINATEAPCAYVVALCRR